MNVNKYILLNLLWLLPIYVFSQSDILIDETDYFDLVNDLTPLDSFEIPLNNENCISENELNVLIKSKANSSGGNLILFKKYKPASKFDKCSYAKVVVYNATDESKVNSHKNLVDIVNRQKYALKIASGYSSSSYFVIIGGEYILPFKTIIAGYFMPSIYFINKEKDELYIQITGPTLFGIIDGYVMKNIKGNSKENRYGVKLDGGFFITEAMAHILPYNWFKYGKQLNYHTTLQPYISYTFGSESYNREIMAGIVITKWLNPNGLIICCK